jgi:hypothetical protein
VLLYDDVPKSQQQPTMITDTDTEDTSDSDSADLYGSHNRGYGDLQYSTGAGSSTKAQIPAATSSTSASTEVVSEVVPVPIPEKLSIMASTSDGFVIAEEDLRLRGPGDLFGFRQHGTKRQRMR